MGEMEESKPGIGKGHVELNGKKYFFVYYRNNSGELILYDEFKQKNLLSCSFDTIANSFTKTKSLLSESKFSSLLLVLCWYSFQPHSNTVAKLFPDVNFL